MTSSTQPDAPAIDARHVLIIGAGPGLGAAIARRFAEDKYHVTLVARRLERLRDLASSLAGTGAVIDTVTGDASDPEGLRSTLTAVYATGGAPGVLIYNAALFGLDSVLTSDAAHLQQAYNVDVVGAVVAAQVAASVMRAERAGTIMFTGGGFADHPVAAMATISLGKAALRSAATMLGADLADDGVRVASLTIAGEIAEGTPFSPGRIAEAYFKIVQQDGAWQSEFRFDGS
jgi:short-subunit dehydrogenase